MTDRIRIVALGDSTTAGTPGWASPIEAPPAGHGDETSRMCWLTRRIDCIRRLPATI